MKLLIYLLPLLLINGCLSGFSQTAVPQPRPVIQGAVDDVVALVTELNRPYCAGVISHSLVITAAHCVEGETGALIGYRGTDNIPVGAEYYDVLYADASQDLAILRPSGSQLRHGRDLAPHAPKDGDVVIAVGHPLGLTWTITTGIVSRDERLGGIDGDQHWFQISTGITFGNSGGPIYNKYGEVVGIASFMMRDHPHLGGAVHWDEIKKALDEVLR